MSPYSKYGNLFEVLSHFDAAPQKFRKKVILRIWQDSRMCRRLKVDFTRASSSKPPVGTAQSLCRGYFGISKGNEGWRCPPLVLVGCTLPSRKRQTNRHSKVSMDGGGRIKSGFNAQRLTHNVCSNCRFPKVFSIDYASLIILRLQNTF